MVAETLANRWRRKIMWLITITMPYTECPFRKLDLAGIDNIVRADMPIPEKYKCNSLGIECVESECPKKGMPKDKLMKLVRKMERTQRRSR